jgi:hypothetical protein
MIRIIPVEHPDKYWDWKYSKPRKKSKFTATDTTMIPCHAILFKLIGTDTIQIWNKRLVNEIAPVNAIVSNDGKTVVTFDNWHTVGYGPGDMVIYDSIGELVKSYELEDISPFPTNDYATTISSRWWRCGATFINNKVVEVCFIDVNEKKKQLKYNTVDHAFTD